MNKARKFTLGVMVVLGVAAWMSLPGQVLAEAMQGHDMHQMNMNMNMKQSPHKEMNGLEMAYSHHIPALSALLEKAAEAIKAGDDQTALDQLKKAQTMVDMLKQAVAQKVQPKIVNTKCPIMGGAIDPEKVTPELTREFKGQTVAFCCGGCPPQWDKLSDAEKEAKLAAVKPETSSGEHLH